MLIRALSTLVLLLPMSSHADDIMERLKKDVVTVKDGKMVIEDVRICRKKGSTSAENAQVILSSEAPEQGLISRDRFVLMHGTLAGMLIGNTELSCKKAPETIGTPDWTFAIVMQTSGAQIAVTSNKGTKRVTKLWSELD